MIVWIWITRILSTSIGDFYWSWLLNHDFCTVVNSKQLFSTCRTYLLHILLITTRESLDKWLSFTNTLYANEHLQTTVKKRPPGFKTIKIDTLCPIFSVCCSTGGATDREFQNYRFHFASPRMFLDTSLCLGLYSQRSTRFMLRRKHHSSV